MKIALIGPGGSTIIPPPGWGAVEILIYDSANALTALGHDVTIINNSDTRVMINEANAGDFDIVHIHYDDRIDMINHLTCKNVAITNHFAYLDQPKYWAHQNASHGGWGHIFSSIVNSRVDIMCLSESIAAIYRRTPISKDRIHVIKNGVRTDLFDFSNTPKYSNKTIYLAKIDYRKRQHIFQNIQGLYYAGNIADDRFDASSSRYLGEWDKPTLYSNLTDYANLALLSDGEAHPLVCMEALSAGLGLVLSEFATANLDLNLPFIDVIPEDKITNIQYISKILKDNRSRSVLLRDQIKEYSNTLSWDNVASGLYIPTYNKIISKSEVKL